MGIFGWRPPAARTKAQGDVDAASAAQPSRALIDAAARRALVALPEADQAQADPEVFVTQQLLPRLIEELREGPLAAREAAIEAVAQLGAAARPALPVLWQIMRQEWNEEPWLRLRARAILRLATLALADDSARSRRDEATEILFRQLHEETDVRVRAEVLMALGAGRTDADRLFDAAREWLHDDAPEMRAAAVRVLARLAAG